MAGTVQPDLQQQQPAGVRVDVVGQWRGVRQGPLVGMWRFDIGLHPAWWLVPGTLLVSLTAASIGYGLASVLAPQLAQLVSQVLVFVVMLFSPVSFPAERMPHWLQHLHHWLPFEPMAELMRSGLDHQTFWMPVRSLVVLTRWGLAAVIAAAWALRRRD